MIVKFLNGIQICAFDKWFNLWLHHWKPLSKQTIHVCLDAYEWQLCLGFFTFEIEYDKE